MRGRALSAHGAARRDALAWLVARLPHTHLNGRLPARPPCARPPARPVQAVRLAILLCPQVAHGVAAWPGMTHALDSAAHHVAGTSPATAPRARHT